MVGKSVTVPVGVNNSAPIWVTVGVNVIGVLVEVAKRFWVGAGVMLAVAVGVSTNGMEVGVLINSAASERNAQLDRRIERTRMKDFFFIDDLLQLNICRITPLWIQNLTVRK